MKACGVSVLSLVDINNPIMASQQSTMKIAPNDGDVVSWGKHVAPELKKRLGLQNGMKHYDGLVASGAEMLRRHEEGELSLIHI